VEHRVASGDWGTPSEYIRELTRQDKERRLAALEEDLLEGISSKPIELSAEEVHKRGSVSVLREKARSH